MYFSVVEGRHKAIPKVKTKNTHIIYSIYTMYASAIDRERDLFLLPGSKEVEKKDRKQGSRGDSR